MFGIGRYLASANVISNEWITLDQYKNIPKSDIIRFQQQYNKYLNGSKAASNPMKPSVNNAEKQNITADLSKNTNNTGGTINEKNSTDNLQNNNGQSLASNKGNLTSKDSSNNNKKNEPPKVTLPQPLINAINSLLKNSSSTVESLLEFYKVSSVSELSIDQANDAIRRLTTPAKK